MGHRIRLARDKPLLEEAVATGVDLQRASGWLWISGSKASPPVETRRNPTSVSLDWRLLPRSLSTRPAPFARSSSRLA